MLNIRNGNYESRAMIKAVKTEADHAAALKRIEELIDLNPQLATPEADELEVLSILVRDFESKCFPIRNPDPIDAIKFRMEQKGLKGRDLIPFLGTRSRVSEILSRRRPLTLSMVRALSEGLGIPAKALVQEAELLDVSDEATDWRRFPIAEMVKRGWIRDSINAVKAFFSDLGPELESALVYRKSDHIRAGKAMDRYALLAWATRVVKSAESTPHKGRYVAGSVTPEFMRSVARLSSSETGPKEAIDFLARHGIILVIEPHLPGTFLDGAAILVPSKNPIIGLTIRHDRLDNFWFALLHELAHVALHLSDSPQEFFDDLDVDSEGDSREREADELAREVSIPTQKWTRSPARLVPSPEAAKSLANKLSIHPAIVAGRIRFERKNFRILNHLVGHDDVRRHFPDIQWQ